MLALKFFLGVFVFIIFSLTCLWTMEHYNLIEGEQSYEVPFPLTSLIITVALIILIMVL